MHRCGPVLALLRIVHKHNTNTNDAQNFQEDIFLFIILSFQDPKAKDPVFAHARPNGHGTPFSPTFPCWNTNTLCICKYLLLLLKDSPPFQLHIHPLPTPPHRPVRFSYGVVWAVLCLNERRYETTLPPVWPPAATGPVLFGLLRRDETEVHVQIQVKAKAEGNRTVPVPVPAVHTWACYSVQECFVYPGCPRCPGYSVRATALADWWTERLALAGRGRSQVRAMATAAGKHGKRARARVGQQILVLELPVDRIVDWEGGLERWCGQRTTSVK